MERPSISFWPHLLQVSFRGRQRARMVKGPTQQSLKEMWHCSKSAHEIRRASCFETCDVTTIVSWLGSYEVLKRVMLLAVNTFCCELIDKLSQWETTNQLQPKFNYVGSGDSIFFKFRLFSEKSRSIQKWRYLLDHNYSCIKISFKQNYPQRAQSQDSVPVSQVRMCK